MRCSTLSWDGLRARQTRRVRGGFAAPGVVDALVGGGDGAEQEGAEALHKGVQEFARGAVEREGPPPLQRVPGEDGAGLQPPSYARVLAVVRPVDGRGEPQGGRVLRGGCAGQLGHAGLEGVEDAVRRTGHGLLPAGRILRLLGEPGAQRRHRGGRKKPPAPGGLGQFGHGEARYVAEAGLGEEGAVLPGHLGHHLVGHPVEDGDQGGLVVLGGAQEVPGDGIGVPRGRGDHDPDVGGADQFGGEDTVVGDEGVDVGGVEEGEPTRQALGGLDTQDPRPVLAGEQQIVAGFLSRLGGRHPHAREVGQYAHPAEPVMVLGMADQYGGPGRGPQYAGLTDPAPHKGVDEGRLAGPGGPTHNGEQGRFRFPQSGHQVVVELREQFVAVGTRAWSPGQGQREACGGDTVAQGGECVEQLRPYVQGHHM